MRIRILLALLVLAILVGVGKPAALAAPLGICIADSSGNWSAVPWVCYGALGPLAGADIFIPSAYSITADNDHAVGNVTVEGTLNGSSFNLSANSLTITIGGAFNGQSGTVTLGGNLTNDGTFNANTGTVVMNGASAQSIRDISAFNNLTINNATGVTLNSNATVNGTLTLNTDLTTASGVVLTMGSTATTSGGADVLGKVKRTSFNAGTPYTFGSAHTTITFASGGTLPSEIVVELFKTTPGGFANAVQRYYSITPTGGSGYTFTLRLRYRDSELSGIDENNLQMWQQVNGRWTLRPVTSRDTTNNWVETTGLTSFSLWALSNNNAPAFTSTPVTAATQDALYTYNVTASDPDHGDALTITAPTLPAWLTLTDHGNGAATLSGTPTGADVGQHPVALRVSDAGGLTATQAFTITVSSALPQPGAFGKVEPVNGATNQNTVLSLRWNPSTDATEYQYCLDTTNNGACDASWVNAGANLSADLTGLAEKTTYYWQVRASNTVGITEANSGAWWSFTTRDTIAPTVVSITRADASPTNATTVRFIVAFSEAIQNVDGNDFSLATTGISGASVTGVSGSGDTYTVTVSTGAGSGTLRLDIPETATISDLAGNPLSGLPYTSGEAYTIDRVTPTPAVTPTSTVTPTSMVTPTPAATSIATMTPTATPTSMATPITTATLDATPTSTPTSLPGAMDQFICLPVIMRGD